jgi:hypothetical protein
MIYHLEWCDLKIVGTSRFVPFENATLLRFFDPQSDGDQMPVSPHLWSTIRILRTMHIEQRCNFYQSMPIPLMVHISRIRADAIHVAPMSTPLAIAFRSKRRRNGHPLELLFKRVHWAILNH